MGYNPHKRLPISISTMLLTECMSCKMELSRKFVGLKEKIWGKRNKGFEELENLHMVSSGDGICFQNQNCCSLDGLLTSLLPLNIWGCLKCCHLSSASMKSMPCRANAVFQKTAFLHLLLWKKLVTKKDPSSAGCKAAPISWSNNLKRALHTHARHPTLTFHSPFDASHGTGADLSPFWRGKAAHLICWVRPHGPAWQLWSYGLLLTAK